jgi:hypothetical protein
MTDERFLPVCNNVMAGLVPAIHVLLQTISP